MAIERTVTIRYRCGHTQIEQGSGGASSLLRRMNEAKDKVCADCKAEGKKPWDYPNIR